MGMSTKLLQQMALNAKYIHYPNWFPCS